jgi:hypothetical protein
LQSYSQSACPLPQFLTLRRKLGQQDSITL